MLKGFFVLRPCGRNAQYIVLFYQFWFFKNVTLKKILVIKNIYFDTICLPFERDTIQYFITTESFNMNKQETQQTD